MSARPLLVVRHVPWEGPHRILDAFDPATPVELVDALTCERPLPAPEEVCGAVFMGGPMSANDTAAHPRLAQEIAWMRSAVAAGVPLLGVCLGSQLLARALGAAVVPGPAPELGVAPVATLPAAAEDPLLRALAPSAHVLHWHGEVFALPDGAVPLARSAATELQAFRFGERAWGLLFHAEADAELLDRWLAEPAMAREAEDALGPDAPALLRAGAARLRPERGDRLFAAFAERCARYPRC